MLRTGSTGVAEGCNARSGAELYSRHRTNPRSMNDWGYRLSGLSSTHRPARTMDGMDEGTPGTAGPATCHRHRDRVTYLRCSRCGRHICGDCSRDSPVGQRCPECAGATTRVVPARSIRSGITPAVLTIMVITVTAYLAQRVNARFTIDYAHITPAVSAGEWWRVITATFLHSTGSIVHILFTCTPSTCSDRLSSGRPEPFASSGSTWRPRLREGWSSSTCRRAPP